MEQFFGANSPFNAGNNYASQAMLGNDTLFRDKAFSYYKQHYQQEQRPNDVARLALFQDLYAYQDARALQLHTENKEELPRNAMITAQSFADTCQHVCDVLRNHTALNSAAQAAFTHVSWETLFGALFDDVQHLLQEERTLHDSAAADDASADNAPAVYMNVIVAQDDTKCRISPAHFLELLMYAAQENAAAAPKQAPTSENFVPESALPTLAVICACALRAHLLLPAKNAAERYTNSTDKNADSPLACPVCGYRETLSWVGEFTAHHGNERVKYCPLCATQWAFERIRCGRCGSKNQGHFHYTNEEHDNSHRILICDECHSYERVVFQEHLQSPAFSIEVEDVVMAPLDALAQSVLSQRA